MMGDLGNHSYTNSDTNGAQVGKFVSIAGGCIFHTNDNHAWINNRNIVSSYPFNERWNVESWPKSGGKGPIIIKNDVWIGSGCHVLSGVTIGDGAIIAANTVITKDVPPYSIMAGNPGQVKSFRFSQDIIDKLRKISWWDWDENTIRARIVDMADINKFVELYI